MTNVPITIVIPTTCRHERADLLRNAIASIHRAAPGAVEVIVAMNGPHVDPEMAAEFQERPNTRVAKTSNGSEQTPCKRYEYLRVDRPILCLSDPVRVSLDALDGAEQIARLRADWLHGQLAMELANIAAVHKSSHFNRIAAQAAHFDCIARGDLLRVAA